MTPSGFEILASALPVWHGAQVAIDATMVSPLGRDGQPRGSSARQAGAVLEQAARRKRETICPELLTARRCRLVVGGRWNGEGFAPRPRPCQAAGAASVAACLSVCRPFTSAGPALFPLRHSGPSPPPSLACLARARMPWMEPPPLREVLAAARHGAAEAVSRLPLRPGRQASPPRDLMGC